MSHSHRPGQSDPADPTAGLPRAVPLETHLPPTPAPGSPAFSPRQSPPSLPPRATPLVDVDPDDQSPARQRAGRGQRADRQGRSRGGVRPARLPTVPVGPTEAPRIAAAEHDSPEPITEVATRTVPPFLVSMAFHMGLFIALALIVIAQHRDDPIDLTVTTVDPTDELEDRMRFEMSAGMDKEIEEPLITPQFLPEVQDPFAAPEPWDALVEDTNPWEQIEAPQIGLALKGREEGMRKLLLGKFGGTGGTQRAVERGLAWLVRNQQRDGSWSLCGPYGDGASKMSENHCAATAMALLAFQGDGHTTIKGDHRMTVDRGWRWLLRQQDSYGNFFREGLMNHPFYTQGQCAIALCELYAMTKDEQYREPAQRAVDYLLRSQSPKGGWRYTPRGDSDVSVTGWVVMALQSARMAGLEVPQENLDRISAYLDSVAMYEGSRYPYQRGNQPTPAMTAEAILCRQYLGWPRDDPRMIKALDWITRPEYLIKRDRDRHHYGSTYFWYYATQACHHMEGDHWKRWNDAMRVNLPAAQVRRGRESGSWNPDMNDPHEAHAGRLYTTCLSLYMLEVYYRHLPIYSNVYRELKR